MSCSLIFAASDEQSVEEAEAEEAAERSRAKRKPVAKFFKGMFPNDEVSGLVGWVTLGHSEHGYMLNIPWFVALTIEKTPQP